MSDESQIKVLSGVLILLCLALLWCWYNKKNKDKFTSNVRKPSYYDKIAYIAPARPDQSEGFKIKGMNDITNMGARNTHVMEKAKGHDLTKTRWMTDGQIGPKGSNAIGVDGFLAKYASDVEDDVSRMYGGVKLPAEVVTPDKAVVPMRSGSLSGDMIRLTEFEPIYGNSTAKNVSI